MKIEDISDLSLDEIPANLGLLYRNDSEGTAEVLELGGLKED